MATALAVVFALFAWLAARRTTTAQGEANAQQAVALRLQSEMLKQAQDSIVEQRNQRIAAARGQASRLQVQLQAGPSFQSPGGRSGVGQPALSLRNGSEHAFHDVSVNFLDAPSPNQRAWIEKLDPGVTQRLPFPDGASSWSVEFMDVEDFSWRVTEQYPMPALWTDTKEGVTE